jgi:hypothetical protein
LRRTEMPKLFCAVRSLVSNCHFSTSICIARAFRPHQ